MKWAVLAGVILSGAGGLTDIPVVAPFSDAAMNVQSFIVMPVKLEDDVAFLLIIEELVQICLVVCAAAHVVT